MNMLERRRQVLEVLCQRRQETYDNLAREFNVSKMTIRRDIAALTCSYPIETDRGRYGGGVRVKEGYYLHHHTLNTEQLKLLNKLKAKVSGDELITLKFAFRDSQQAGPGSFESARPFTCGAVGCGACKAN